MEVGPLQMIRGLKLGAVFKRSRSGASVEDLGFVEAAAAEESKLARRVQNSVSECHTLYVPS